jgi:hypothetical protein
MAKRYYLADIIGDGSIDNPYRPAGVDGLNHVAVFPPQDPNTGVYSRPHCLVLVNTPNHATLRGRQGVDPLPDFPLDGKVQAVETAARQSAESALNRRGFASGQFTLKDGYREVIRSIGKELDSNFDENNFDVSE